MKRVATERRMGGDDDAERAPNPRDLLDRDRVGQGVESGAAFLFGKRNTEQAHRAKLGDDVGREATVLLVLVDLVDYLTLQKIADGSAEQLLLGGQFEIHEGSG